MEMERLYDAVIIGGGPAGLTASLYLARAGYRVLVMEENNFGGQIVITEKVVNYPGIYETSGAELTGIMKKQGTRFGAEYLKAKVLSLWPDKEIKVINTDKGVFYAFSILATALVVPFSFAAFATSSSDIKQCTSPPYDARRFLFIPERAICVSVTISAPFFIAFFIISTTFPEKHKLSR